jgi:hypothetical protein
MKHESRKYKSGKHDSKLQTVKPNVLLTLLIAALTVGIGWAAFQKPPANSGPLSKSIPSGALLYFQARDFSSLLSDWNRSSEKRQWLGSSNYQVFSRSRLLLRLRDAGNQFANAAGLPPDMNFLSQIAGNESALALYDIGKLQFLYITRVASANSMQSQLWQSKSKFETRSTGGATFYVRHANDSEREVEFAINGDYLLLATREDLMASALQLMAGRGGPDTAARSIESEPWWSQSVAAAGASGDLRMVLNLDKIVPSPYFRSYWIQQNVTDMKQYTAAISDIYRENQQYREERVLLKRSGNSGAADGESGAVSGLARLIPDNAGVYEARKCPSVETCFEPLETKLLAPHLGPHPPAQTAPQAQLTSGEGGTSFDLETRIDQAPLQNAADSRASSALKELLKQNSVQGVLQVQSTKRATDGVFVRIHSAVAMAGGSEWNEDSVHTALTSFLRPNLTAGELGTGWRQTNSYYELDGLRTLLAAVRGKYLIVSDDAALMSGMLANVNRKIEARPVTFVAGFDHQHERENFSRFASSVDRPDRNQQDGPANARTPQFFSENIASLSSTLAGISSERIVVRSEGDKELQTVIYKWVQ